MDRQKTIDAIHHPRAIRTMKKVSRFVIFAPLVIVVAAFLMSSYQRYTLRQSVMNAPDIKITPQATPVPETKPKSRLRINLIGPFVCGYSDTSASLSAAIQDKQIALSISEGASSSAEYRLVDNCLYAWKSPLSEGKKVCNLQDYLSTFEVLSSFGGLDAGSLLSMLPGDKPDIATNSAVVDGFVESCAKKDVPEGAFTIPDTVTFRETTLEEVQSK